MLLFNLIRKRLACKKQGISIHLMLLFNQKVCDVLWTGVFISIHLMLLFNPCKTVREVQQRVISIHLMLLFNKSLSYEVLYLPDFNTSNVTIQLHHQLLQLRTQSDFNTSNVTIQHTYLKIRVSVRLISIHLMLLFNARC